MDRFSGPLVRHVGELESKLLQRSKFLTNDLEEDERYRKFLLQSPSGASDFRTTVQ